MVPGGSLFSIPLPNRFRRFIDISVHLHVSSPPTGTLFSEHHLAHGPHVHANTQQSSFIFLYLSDYSSIKVPLSLVIRMTSLRGTLRLHIKPPPSDQLWLAFTSMPDIDFNLESSIGEHKINSGHIALFLISRLKVLELSFVMQRLLFCT